MLTLDLPTTRLTAAHGPSHATSRTRVSSSGPSLTPAAASQLAFFLDVAFEAQGIRITRLDHADGLNDGAIRVTREARRRELPCLELPVYRSMDDVVREALAIARRKRRRSGRSALPALALVYTVQPLRLHGRSDTPRNPNATGSVGGKSSEDIDNASWDACARAYTIVLVEATE